jgi:hypothetical protein
MPDFTHTIDVAADPATAWESWGISPGSTVGSPA